MPRFFNAFYLFNARAFLSPNLSRNIWEHDLWHTRTMHLMGNWVLRTVSEREDPDVLTSYVIVPVAAYSIDVIIRIFPGLGCPMHHGCRYGACLALKKAQPSNPGLAKKFGRQVNDLNSAIGRKNWHLPGNSKNKNQRSISVSPHYRNGNSALPSVLFVMLVIPCP